MENVWNEMTEGQSVSRNWKQKLKYHPITNKLMVNYIIYHRPDLYATILYKIECVSAQCVVQIPVGQFKAQLILVF